MTEIISAHDYATRILQRSIINIAVARIQKTWRSFIVERSAQIERAQAEMHKVENLTGPSWKNKEYNMIKDLLEEMEVKKVGSRLTFGEKNKARTSNGFTYKMCNRNRKWQTNCQTKYTHS